MEGKAITGILVVAGAALIAANVVLTGGQDKKPPVIHVGEADLTYTEGDGYEALLADVTAEDNKDKDMTDKVFVDRVVSVRDGEHATVVYAAIDSSNNVATAERVVKYVPNPDAVKKDGKDTADQDQDKNKKDTEEKDKDKDKKKDGKDTSDKEQTADRTSEEDQTADDVSDQTDTDGQDSEEDQGELTSNGKLPAIRLKQHKATINVGDYFDAISYVDDVADDADKRTTLFKHIHVDGKYSTKTAGTYILKYYVTDSNGNASNIEEFTLVVE